MKSTLITMLLALGLPAAAQEVRQIQINTKVIRVPLDAQALREAGLSFDAGEGMSNLGIIPADKAAAAIVRLEKMSGFQLLNAPSMTTKSGLRSTVQSVREFVYPSEYVAPKFSPAPDGKPVQINPGQGISVAPAVPENFHMRPVGFRMEVDPGVAQDGSTVEVNLAPELVGFAGFVNYSSPIKAVVADKDGKVQEVTLTENQVLQPVFESVKTVTAARIPSGQVLVLAGANGGTLPSATTKPDLKQEAKLEGKPTHAVFFFIQAKVFTP